MNCGVFMNEKGNQFDIPKPTDQAGRARQPEPRGLQSQRDSQDGRGLLLGQHPQFPGMGTLQAPRGQAHIEPHPAHLRADGGEGVGLAGLC